MLNLMCQFYMIFFNNISSTGSNKYRGTGKMDNFYFFNEYQTEAKITKLYNNTYVVSGGPTLSTSVIVEGSPTIIELTFDEDISANANIDEADFGVKVNGSVATISEAITENNKVKLTLASRVWQGDTVSDLSYNVSTTTSKNIVGANGITVDAFSGVNVSNTTTIVEPKITNISTNKADGSYKAGETIDIILYFSKNVNLSGGDLHINLDAAANPIVISTIANTNTATGTYTVGATDNSSELTVSSISLSAGTLKDDLDNETNLTIGTGINLNDDSNIVIDTTAPTACIIIPWKWFGRCTRNTI